MTYTREDILNMPVGKELDQLVADAVGFVSLTTDFYTNGIFGYLPTYSTEISEAWEVVEGMISDGFNPTINTITTRNVEYKVDKRTLGEYHCCFSKCDGFHAHGYGKTAPEAICKAALLAILESGGTKE